MKTHTRLPVAAALAAALTMTTSVVATAVPADGDHPEVVSEAGIPAVQIAPPGLTDAELERAIQGHDARTAPRGDQPSVVTPLGTGQYVTYCEEGSSGLMPWTNNSPAYCYGTFYEYLDGARVAKVNMIQLKAYDDSLNPAPEVALKEWCDNNGTYCAIAFALAGSVGKYLRALLR